MDKEIPGERYETPNLKDREETDLSNPEQNKPLNVIDTGKRSIGKKAPRSHSEPTRCLLASFSHTKLKIKDKDNPLLKDVARYDEMAHTFDIGQVHLILTGIWQKHQNWIKKHHKLRDNCTLDEFLKQTTLISTNQLAKLQNLMKNGHPYPLLICDEYLLLRIRVHWNDRVLQAPFAKLSPHLNWREMQTEYPALRLKVHDSAQGVFCRTFADITRPFGLQNEHGRTRLERRMQSLQDRSQYKIMAMEKHQQLSSMFNMLEDPLGIIGKGNLSRNSRHGYYPSRTTKPSVNRAFHTLSPRFFDIAQQPVQRPFATASYSTVNRRGPSLRRNCSVMIQARPLSLRAACLLASASIAIGECLGGR